MLLWFKKLIKPKWYLSYDCEECCNHYCGSCGRGVQEGNYYWFRKNAVAAGEAWLKENLSDTSYKQELVHTDLGGHLTIAMTYVDEDEKVRHYSIFVSVDPRQYW